MSIAGTLGNLLVCLAVAKVPLLRRPANFLLFSLALADLLVTMVCVPLFLVILTRRAFFNDCAKDLERPYVILSMLSCSASVEHIAAISVDRVIAILYPLHYKGIMENRGWKAMLLVLDITDCGSRFEPHYSEEISQTFRCIRNFQPQLHGCVCVVLSDSNIAGQTSEKTNTDQSLSFQ